MIIYPLPTFWLCKVKLKTFITLRSRVQETEQNSGSCDSLWGYLWLHTGQLALPFSLFLVGTNRPCPSHCISIDPTSTLPSALPPTCCASSYFCSQSMNSQRPEAEGGNVPIPPLPFFFALFHEQLCQYNAGDENKLQGMSQLQTKCLCNHCLMVVGTALLPPLEQ